MPGQGRGDARWQWAAAAVLCAAALSLAAPLAWLAGAGSAVGPSWAFLVVPVLAVAAAGMLLWRMATQLRAIARQQARLDAAAAVAAKAESQAHETATRLERTLAFMDQGLMMIDGAGTVVVCNTRANDLLGLPHGLPIIGRSFRTIYDYQKAQGEFRHTEPAWMDRFEAGGLPNTPPVFERRRPDGQTIEMRTTRLDDGSFIRTYTDITARRVAEELVRHRASHDDMTGLLNRLSFRQRLQTALEAAGRAGHLVAVLFLDLDRFKAVNDTFGHGTGDKLLAAVAERIAGLTRTTDLVARHGGDEFAVAATRTDTEDEAAGLAARLVTALSAPYIIEGETLDVGVSIGIACFPRHGHTAELLLQRADTALYAAKNAGRMRHCIYEWAAPPVTGTEPSLAPQAGPTPGSVA